MALETMTTVNMTMYIAVSLILLLNVAYVWNALLDKTAMNKASLRPLFNQGHLDHGHFKMIPLELSFFLYLAILFLQM